MARQQIIEAACEIAAQEGPFSLTLERVASRAGVSKGGLLYHFGTKEALVAGMLDSLTQENHRKIASEVERGLSLGEAYVATDLVGESGEHQLFAVLISIVAIDRRLAERLRPFVRSRIDALIESGVAHGNAQVFCFALDGYFVATSLGAYSPSERELASFRSALLGLLAPTECQLLAEIFREALRSFDERSPG